MKLLTSIASSLLVAGVLLTNGCGKSSPTGPGDMPPMEIYGVKIDMPKLQEAFVNGTPEQLLNVREAVSSLRYRQYPNALMSLDKLVNDASLTEPQKKIVNQVIEQMKELINKAPAQPGQ